MHHPIKTLVYAFASLLALLFGTARAQSFQIVPGQVDLVVAPGFNHADTRVPISGTAPGFDFTSLHATSDVSWVTPTIDSATHDVVLSFTTAALINSSNTATITVSGAGSSDFFSVRAAVAPLNITKLVDDPFRSRMYGVQQNGINAGAVVVLDPLTNTSLACITVGKKPTDLAVSPDGTELLVVNAADASYTAIDLATFRVKETTVFGTYGNWGVSDTTADIAYGSGNILYYTDGNWAPILYVYNRATKQVLQQVTDNGDGVGDFALSPDGKMLYLWQQYGWSAGSMNSNLARYSIAADGKLTFVERTNNGYPNGYVRDPLDTPVLIDAGTQHVFAKQFASDPTAITQIQRTFPSDVYSISPGGEIAVTNHTVIEVNTSLPLLDLPVTTSVQAITSDYARLVYFNPTSHQIATINLIDAIGSKVLNRDLAPVDGAITLAPDKLNWTPLPGIDKYRVYLGLSRTGVQAATTASAEYLGESATPSFPLSQTFVPGATYYWRIDAVSSVGVSPGAIYSFTISPIGSSLTKIDTATVQGHATHQIDVTLSSGSALAWQAQSDAAWVKFASATGSSPGTLSVILDASQLTAGLHTASVTLKLASTGDFIFSLPVTLQVDPLNLSHLESDRTSGSVYAISEAPFSTYGQTFRAYLLELDSVARTIKRVIRVGTSVSDLAIHYGEGRIYVPNWRTGSLLAIDKSTFQQVRAYGFTAFTSVGYGQNDVYRVAAGTTGRLMVEEEDQWVDLSIFDTTTGTKLKNQGERQGGGKYSPDGRFYYHGDDNSSGAEIHKFDVTGDVFTELAHVRVESVSYYGSRTVVVSEDGERVFWNGGVFDKNLTLLWTTGDEIFSCSGDGKYAFSQTKVYDVQAKAAILSMPATTRVSAYNSTTHQLVVQNSTGISFVAVGGTDPFPAPVLTTGATTTTSIALTWTDNSLESSFTLQQRLAGTTAWQDTLLSANSTSQTVAGLTPSTTYEFRIKADAGSQTSAWSDIVSATTVAIVPPTVTTLPATNVTAYSATLNGSVDLHGDSYAVYFDYGVDPTHYDSRTYGYTYSDGSVAATLYYGLLPSTTYHCQLVVEGPVTVRGADVTFTTLPPPPLAPNVSSPNAIHVTGGSAVITASVNPNGSATTYTVGYSTYYGSYQYTSAVAIGSGSTAVSTSTTLTGLLPDTTYYYYIGATNAGGTASSYTYSFHTSSTTGPGTLTAVDDSAFTVSGRACTVHPLANDLSSTGDQLQLLSVGKPSSGNAVLNGDGSITYQPSPDFGGLDLFSYSVADQHGHTAAAMVTVRSFFDVSAGSYTALIGDRETDFAHSGLLGLSIARTGVITAKLAYAGNSYPLSLQFQADATASATIPRPSQTPLVLGLQLDAETHALTGNVTTGGVATALSATRNPYGVQNSAPQAGRYTVLLPSDDAELFYKGVGYATATVTAAGTVQITGSTAAGAPFSASSFLGSDGRFAFYAVAQGFKRTSFHGWIDVRNVVGVSNFDGTVGASEAGGSVTTPLTLLGSRYIASATKIPLPLTPGPSNARLDFWNGATHLTPNPARATLKAASLSSVDARISKLTLNAQTGLFSGQVKVAGNLRPFTGVLFQAQGIGAGMLTLPNATGSVHLVDPSSLVEPDSGIILGPPTTTTTVLDPVVVDGGVLILNGGINYQLVPIGATLYQLPNFTTGTLVQNYPPLTAGSITQTVPTFTIGSTLQIGSASSTISSGAINYTGGASSIGAVVRLSHSTLSDGSANTISSGAANIVIPPPTSDGTVTP